MGKKSKLKAIRKIASQMPTIPIMHKVGEIVTGDELKSKGVNIVSGKDVIAGQNYRQVKTEQKAMNHNRQMKRLYNKHGAAGVNGYIQAVKRHISAQKPEIPVNS